MGIYYIDGEFVEADRAVLPVNDLAVLRGYGVFDFLRTYRGRPFHLDDHIRRLQHSAELIGLSCPWALEELRDIAEQTLSRNDYAEANIRFVITGGASEDSITPATNPRLLVMVTPIKTFPGEWYRDGVGIVTAELTRYIPGAKTIDYIRAIMTLRDAQAAGAVEAVYVDREEYVLEGTTSNIFAVVEGRLVTPSDDILPGVTRDVALRILASEFQTDVRKLSRQELLASDEVFLTSSNKEILPVVRIDGQPVGSGVPGNVTKRIMAIFRAYADNYEPING